ncbi:DUF5958 family protein [Streptomyces sp. NPDC007251]|uniref:DUF5958 family protein n=1 Tax=Streptomyces sp. NPDC007251 TaxID=3154483 RepID=UPI0033D02F77
MLLNELAQGTRPLAKGVGWFEGLADNEQCTALRDLAGFCIQAHATSKGYFPEPLMRARFGWKLLMPAAVPPAVRLAQGASAVAAGLTRSSIGQPKTPTVGQPSTTWM